MKHLDEVIRRLDQHVADKMTAYATPGLAIALTNADELLHIGTYGYADVAAQRPVAPETRFEIGSDGKTFTAIAILQQVEAGRIDLHAPVTTYLPWFTVQSEHAPITIHHLLTHTAGLIAGTDFAASGLAEVWALRTSPTGFAPGAHHYYSNVGYKVLGLVLEHVLGQPYSAIIRSGILEPLRMNATDAAITHAARPRLAVGYQYLYDDRPARRTDPLVPAPWLETDTGDGCLASTAGDMARFLRMLLNRGAGPDGEILTPASFQLLTQRVVEVWDEAYYGYGIITSTTGGFTRLMHGGDMPGYESVWRADPDFGLGVVVLMNGPLAPGVADFALRLLRTAKRDQELYAVPPPPDFTSVEQGDEYVGTYESDERSFAITADGEHLILHYLNQEVLLEQQDDDCFVVDHPDFAHFLLTFGREDDQVVEAFSGGEWFHNGRYSGPEAFAYPMEWHAYTGHYRAHNPWRTNIRVVLRKGQLLVVDPAGDETPLVPLGDSTFRAGEEEFSPERMLFDMIVDGKTLRADASGCAYYRFFTP